MLPSIPTLMQRLTALFLLSLPVYTLADGYSRTDAFEHSKGLEIVSNTRLIGGFSVLDMFGGDYSTGPGQTIFDDRSPPGDIDVVEFKTIEEVPLIGFMFASQADGAYLRASLEVTLRIDRDENPDYEIVYGPFQILPIAQNQDIVGITNFSTDFPQVVASRFRFEMKRYPMPPDNPAPADPWLGPRVWELDAKTTPNPDRPVVLLEMAGGPDFTEPATIDLSALASDGNGVQRVEFYSGDQLLATKTAGPYTFKATNLKGGKHVFRAKAVDSLGAAEWSNQEEIRVSFLPVQIKNPHWLVDGRFSFTLEGLAPGESYVVMSSVDLKNWTGVETIYAGGSTQEWFETEPEAVPSAQRYFQVKLVELE